MTKPVLGIFTPILHLPGIKKTLTEYFDVLYYPDTTYKQALLNIDKVEYIFTNPNKLKFRFDSKILKNAYNLKVFATASTGQDHVDLDYLRSKGIEFISLRSQIDLLEKLTSTSELAFLFLMSYARKFVQAVNHVKECNWDYEKFIGSRIQDLKVGVIGFGRLGRIFSNYCYQFGAKVGVYDPYVNIDSKYISYDNLGNLFKDCDAVSIHVHLETHTANLVNSKYLNLTKSNFALINTSRGLIVNELDVSKWIDKSPGHFYLADVLSSEQGEINENILLKRLVSSDQVFITPHIGGMTFEGQKMAYERITNKLIESLQIRSDFFA